MRYEIDFDKIKKQVTLPLNPEPLVEKKIRDYKGETSITTIEYERNEVIDGTKYEMINKMLDTIMHTEINTGEDNNIEKMLTEAHFGFRLAFETLEAMGIIKYIED